VYFNRLRVFLSHASEQTDLAAKLNEKLRARGAEVFFDRDDGSLPSGESYDDRIRNAILACDVFVILVSPESMTPGHYTLTELGYARERWSNPAGRVLPVFVPQPPSASYARLSFDHVDPYLTQGVTVFSPSGDFSTDTANEVFKLGRRRWRGRGTWLVAAGASLTLLAVAATRLPTRIKMVTPFPSGSVAPEEQAALPGGVHHKEFVASFDELYGKLEALDWAARNVRDVFKFSGEAAIDPDPATDALLTDKINAYNSAYKDLDINHAKYVDSVTQWVPESTNLAGELADVVAYALNDVHKRGILPLNDTYVLSQQVKTLKNEHGAEVAAKVAALRTKGAADVQTNAERLSQLLEVLGTKLESVSSHIVR
jgi:hypothetical protein